MSAWHLLRPEKSHNRYPINPALPPEPGKP